MDCSSQAPLFIGFSRQEYWSRLPCPPPGDLPGPGIKPVSLASPALAGRFFTSSAPWEAWTCSYKYGIHESASDTGEGTWSSFHFILWFLRQHQGCFVLALLLPVLSGQGIALTWKAVQGQISSSAVGFFLTGGCTPLLFLSVLLLSRVFKQVFS